MQCAPLCVMTSLRAFISQRTAKATAICIEQYHSGSFLKKSLVKQRFGLVQRLRPLESHAAQTRQ
jgi:hypothetical protein